jgi:hypothetical protein
MPGRPVNIKEEVLVENTDNILMPPNMTSLLQPLDNGVLVSPKAYYLGLGVQGSSLWERNDKPSVWEIWKGYYIKTTDNLQVPGEVTTTNRYLVKLLKLWWMLYGGKYMAGKYIGIYKHS